MSPTPHFLGPLLDAYQLRHGLDDAGLAALLGCPRAVLTSLRLCPRPGAGNQTAAQDVADITRRFGVDADALARVLQDVSP